VNRRAEECPRHFGRPVASMRRAGPAQGAPEPPAIGGPCRRPTAGGRRSAIRTALPSSLRGRALGAGAVRSARATPIYYEPIVAGPGTQGVETLTMHDTFDDSRELDSDVG
jgi:hypothetical protein